MGGPLVRVGRLDLGLLGFGRGLGAVCLSWHRCLAFVWTSLARWGYPAALAGKVTQETRRPQIGQINPTPTSVRPGTEHTGQLGLEGGGAD